MAQEGDVVLITGKDDISQFFYAFLGCFVCALFSNRYRDAGEKTMQVMKHCKHLWLTSFSFHVIADFHEV
jgi:hypothetical protein